MKFSGGAHAVGLAPALQGRVGRLDQCCSKSLSLPLNFKTKMYFAALTLAYEQSSASALRTKIFCKKSNNGTDNGTFLKSNDDNDILGTDF